MNNLEQIRRVKAEVEADLLKRPGVTGVDIGYKTVSGQETRILSIRIYVEHKHDVSEAEMLPKFIQNIPTDVVEKRFVLHDGF
jgi:S-adenosylmethionine synthetase